MSVAVSPSNVIVEQGATKTFSAVVSGTGSPAQGVTWTVSGAGEAATSISETGVLTVGANESPKELTVKAVSTADTGKYGTAAVTVIKPLSILTLTVTGTDYGIGEPLAFTLNAVYTDTTSANIEDLIQLSDFIGYNPLAAGSQTIKVKIGEIESNSQAITIKTLAQRIAAVGATETITLYGSENFQGVSSTNIPSGKSITLIGAGSEKIISLTGNGSMFYITGSLTLGNNVTLRGHTGNNLSLIQISNGGAFTMDGGEISGNTSEYGGGVSVDSGGTFNMNGGEISGNTSEYGGGVFAYYSFTMNGGEISGNTSDRGGGVFVDSYGTFTMSDGEISGNTSDGGGGVYVYGTFTMSDGRISGNTTTSFSGGGVYVNGGAFNMSGGEIFNNAIPEGYIGGGVHVSSGNFTMSGGEIYSNTAAVGSGVAGHAYATGSFTFSKQSSGGVIYGSDGGSKANSATSGYNNAVYLWIESSEGDDMYHTRTTTVSASEELKTVVTDGSVTSSSGNWEIYQ